MIQVFQFREENRNLIPARQAMSRLPGPYLQTVSSPQPLQEYHRLIETLSRPITGIPMVLNTSFNENEPCGCRTHTKPLDWGLPEDKNVPAWFGKYVISRAGRQPDGEYIDYAYCFFAVGTFERVRPLVSVRTSNRRKLDYLPDASYQVGVAFSGDWTADGGCAGDSCQIAFLA